MFGNRVKFLSLPVLIRNVRLAGFCGDSRTHRHLFCNRLQLNVLIFTSYVILIISKFFKGHLVTQSLPAMNSRYQSTNKRNVMVYNRSWIIASQRRVKPTILDCTTTIKVNTTNLSSTKRIPENSISQRKSLIEVNRWKNDCTAVPTDSDWHRLWIRHILHNSHRIEPSHRQVGLLKPFITVQSFNLVFYLTQIYYGLV